MVHGVHPIKVAIVYYSRFGALKAVADEIALGAQQVPLAEVLVQLIEVGDQPAGEARGGESPVHAFARRRQLLEQLAEADALVVGAPGYFGSMASPVKRFFEDCLTDEGPPNTDRTRPWAAWRLHSKVGAAFAASATPHGGNEQTLQSILTMFMHLGMIVVTPGQAEPILENQGAPYGATVVTGPTGQRMSSDEEQQWARALGRRVAETALWLRWGQDEWLRAREGPLPVD